MGCVATSVVATRRIASSMVSGIDRSAISARIAEARLQAGFTQAELADVMDVHYRTVQNWETASRGVPFERLEELADVLGVSRRWLLHGDELDDERVGELERQLAELRLELETAQREARAAAALQLEQLETLRRLLESLPGTSRGPGRAPP